jgi:uncharacterized protein DUF1902
MNRLSIIVRATWDDEAEVWVAQSADVQGLREKILAIIPELIELNGVESNLPEIPVHIVAERTARVVNPRY